MRSDSPPASWYEPPSYTSWEDAELVDDDDDQVDPQPETLTIRGGSVRWTAAAPLDDEA